ncbi:hypothetical protein AAON49_07930 [Pseudotenacibaculum sp. MALMAid0570]|uniref:hypothetical protein n=1 Tax=Pseudotenacibaculum sp. MALMAid0570 TaxID=3143938 RepID=UPI0032DF84AB
MNSTKIKSNIYIQATIVLAFSIVFCLGCRTKATVLAWDTANTPLDFPEAKLNLPSTGVCFSGGGTRAMNCALGQMKGLDSLGLWNDIGYISAVSGGSWASTIFTYYNSGAENDKQLLGTIAKPNEISMELLGYMPKGFMGEVISKHLIDDALERLALGSLTLGILQKMDYVWIDAVGSTYLKPYGLYDPKHPKYFTLNDSTRNAILDRNPKLKVSDFITVHNQKGDIKRPFLIVNSSLLAPNKYLPIKNPENLSVFNYTPLYIGSNNPIGVTDTEILTGKTISFNAGGGFVESFGFGSDLLRSQNRQLLNNQATKLRVKLAKQRFEAVDATGTSSAAYGAMFSSSLLAQVGSEILTHFSADQLIPEEEYWPISENGVVEDAQKYRFTDGGNLENFGLISLLQRGVKKAVVFINTNTPLDVTLEPSANCPPLPSQVSSDLFPLFGYNTGNQIHNQVFKQSDFNIVYEGLAKAKKEGKTVMTKTKLKTKANKWWGIKENQSVEVLWVYNEFVYDWYKDLPDEVKKEICKGPNGKFPDFPLYKLIGENGLINGISLTKEQVNLLYQLSAWNVYSNKEVFDFLKGK